MIVKLGDLVNYGAMGDCKVENIERKNLTGTDRDYYVLRQLNNGSTIYLPCEKANALKPAIVRLTKAQLEEILNAEPAEIVAQGDKERENAFNAVIAQDDAKSAAALLKALLNEQATLKANKKKPRAIDVKTTTICEKIVYAHIVKTVEIELDGIAPLVTGATQPVYRA